MNKSVFGLAKNVNHAERVVTQLQQNGFTSEDISVLFADSNRDRHATTNLEDQPKYKKGTLGMENTTKAPEGAATGATTGGIIGGTLGLLAGIGALAIPGLGAFIAAGPIIAALSGSAIGGATGLLVGSLIGLGIPEYEAKKYQDELESGHVLLCVHAKNSDQCEKAKNILQQSDVQDISCASEKAGKRHQ